MPLVMDHLERFVDDSPDSPMFLGATGEPLRPSNFWVIWEHARKRVDLKPVRFHDLRHFAATMFASTGASTKEIMSRGGWKSVTMVVRYEHASEERDAFLADALNPYTQTELWCRSDHVTRKIAHLARTKVIVPRGMKTLHRL